MRLHLEIADGILRRVEHVHRVLDQCRSFLFRPRHIHIHPARFRVWRIDDVIHLAIQVFHLLPVAGSLRRLHGRGALLLQPHQLQPRLCRLERRPHPGIRPLGLFRFARRPLLPRTEQRPLPAFILPRGASLDAAEHFARGVQVAARQTVAAARHIRLAIRQFVRVRSRLGLALLPRILLRHTLRRIKRKFITGRKPFRAFLHVPLPLRHKPLQRLMHHVPRLLDVGKISLPIETRDAQPAQLFHRAIQPLQHNPRRPLEHAGILRRQPIPKLRLGRHVPEEIIHQLRPRVEVRQLPPQLPLRRADLASVLGKVLHQRRQRVHQFTVKRRMRRPHRLANLVEDNRQHRPGSIAGNEHVARAGQVQTVEGDQRPIRRFEEMNADAESLFDQFPEC